MAVADIDVALADMGVAGPVGVVVADNGVAAPIGVVVAENGAAGPVAVVVPDLGGAAPVAVVVPDLGGAMPGGAADSAVAAPVGAAVAAAVAAAIADIGVAAPGGVLVPDLGGAAPVGVAVTDMGVAGPGGVVVADVGVAAPGGVLVPGMGVAAPGGDTQASLSPRVSVVIPALNEARNLPYVFAQLPRDVHEVVLVDGHSTDDTVAVARALYDAVRVVYQTRRGKGNALNCGFTACSGDIIVMLDADGSTSTAEIPRFVAALRDGADFAKGSRFAPGGGSVDITRLRRLGNWGLTGLVNTLFGTQYTDLCYGYNAFWRRCLPAIHVDCDGFEVETLINIRAAQAGLRIAEVPSMEGHRIFGESNLNAWRDGRRILKTILTERFTWRRALKLNPYVHAELAQALLSQPHVHAEPAQARRPQPHAHAELELDGVAA